MGLVQTQVLCISYTSLVYDKARNQEHTPEKTHIKMRLEHVLKVRKNISKHQSEPQLGGPMWSLKEREIVSTILLHECLVKQPCKFDFISYLKNICNPRGV